MSKFKKTAVRTKVNKIPPKKLKSKTTKKISKKSPGSAKKPTPFLVKMSHGLRTPLNAIIGFSEMIYKGKAGTINKEQREYLNDVLSSAKDLLHFVKNISKTARHTSVKVFKIKKKPLPKTNKRRS